MNYREITLPVERECHELFSMLFYNSYKEAKNQHAAVIQGLVDHLLRDVEVKDIRLFMAEQQGVCEGALFVTRLSYPTQMNVWMVAPVVVRTRRQNEGIGQALINHALQELRVHGAEVAVTYGDIGYYNKTGFETVSESLLQAPIRLTSPQDWLAQSLTDQPLQPIQGKPICVAAFENPVYW